MLQLQYKDQRAPAIWLTSSRFIIGQDEKNDLVLNEPSISAFHAEIRTENELLFLSDAGSLNGTYVNGEKIQSRYQLRPGDNLQFGSSEFVLLDPKQSKQISSSQASSASADWSVHLIRGPEKNKTFPIKGKVTVGRSKSCDVHFQDEKLSRTHFELIAKSDHLEVRDLNSANGTKVNQKLVTSCRLKPGDLITVSELSFLIIGPSEAQKETAEADGEETVFLAAAAPKPAKVSMPKPKVATPTSANQQAARNNITAKTPLAECSAAITHPKVSAPTARASTWSIVAVSVLGLVAFGLLTTYLIQANILTM